MADLFSAFSDASTGTDLSAAGSVIGGLGSAVSGIFGAEADTAKATGYGQEAALYQQAAQQAGNDVGLVLAGGEIQQSLMARQAQKIESKAGAAEAYGNLGPGGSAALILQDSQRQAALSMGQARTETQLQASQFTQMQTAYNAEAQGALGAQKAAQAAAKGSGIGGTLGTIGSIVGAVAMFA